MKLGWILFLVCLSVIVIAGCSQPVDLLETPAMISTGETLEATETPNYTPTETSLPITPIPEITPTATAIQASPPDWFEQAVIYEIFVRSFADSDSDGIGDLTGITQNLDYLESLAVDVIWLMPIYASPSVHGYDVTDFYQVNPEYGTLEDLQELVRLAHAKDMQVILDFVPSHLSDQNELFSEAYRNPESARSDWFVWTNDAHTTYAGFADSSEMPRFNHYNPDVVNYLIDAARFWLDLDSDGDMTDGIDGFRVDNVTFPPREFFYQLRNGVKAANPDAVLLGEAWVHKPSDLAPFFLNQFDSLFDFPLYELMQGSQDANQDGLLAGKGFPVLLSSLIEDSIARYPEENTTVFFLNNHDTNRIATEVGSDPERLTLAPALLAAYPGPVLIYYGDEIGMQGQKGGPPYWDNYRREPFDWYIMEDGDFQTTWFQPPDRWNQPSDGISVEEEDPEPDSLLNFYRQAFQLREEHAALSKGSLILLEMEVSGQGPWGFIRQSGDDIVYAVYNFGTEIQSAAFEVDVEDDQLVDLLSGDLYFIKEGSSTLMVELPSGSALWLTAP